MGARVKQFGFLLMAVAVVAFFGWYKFDWQFVDPFLTTLVFVAGPFFVRMGTVSPHPAEVVQPASV